MLVSSSHPDPILDQEMSFYTVTSFQTRLLRIMSSLLRLKTKISFIKSHFRFLSYSFGMETINTFIHSVVPSKTIPDS